MRSLLSTVAALLFTSSSLYASNSVSTGYMLTEEDFFSEIPKVISAARLVQPINEAPAALTVIDQEMIEASGARNLVDIFRLVPGFITGYWAGNQQMVMYQGLGTFYARQIQVMIDGRAVYIPSLGGAPWGDLPLALSEIQRVEVTRGPNAVNFGSNSFFAVINFVTKKASDGAAIMVNRRVGSGDLSDYEIHENINAEKLQLRLSISRHKDDGFEALYDGLDKNIFNLRTDYEADNGDRWSVYLGQANAVQGRGGYGEIIDRARDVNTTYDYQHIRWESRKTVSGEWAIQAYRTYHKITDEYQTAPIPSPPIPNGVFINQSHASKRYDVEIQNTLTPTNWLRLVWGGSIRKDEVIADGYFREEGNQKTDTDRLFINTEWRPFQSVLLHAGGMYEDHTLVDEEWSPRIALSYTPVANHTFRASRSKATRIPTAFENSTDTKICVDAACTVFDWVYYSDGGIRPERIDSKEIAYVGNILKHTIFDVRLYKNRVTDYIWTFEIPAVDAVDNEVWTYENTHNIDISGGEIQLSYKKDKNRLVISYAHNHVDVEGSSKPERIMQSFPEESGSIMWSRVFSDGYSAAATYYYIGSLRHLDGDKNPLTGYPLDPIRRLDLQFGKRLNIGNLDLKLTAGVQNVFDEYIDYRKEIIIDTRYYLLLNASVK